MAGPFLSLFVLFGELQTECQIDCFVAKLDKAAVRVDIRADDGGNGSFSALISSRIGKAFCTNLLAGVQLAILALALGIENRSRQLI